MKIPPATQDQMQRLRVRDLPPRSPLAWLRRGWRDLMRSPGPGLLHGAAAALFGGLLFWVARDHFWLLAGAFSGFLLVAPIIATGLYLVSRGIERGRRRIPVAESLAIWRPRDGRLIIFGILLAFSGTGWVMTSASLITEFAAAPVNKPIDFIRVVMLDEQSWLFEAWLALGAVLAAPVFASSVVALPLFLDREVGIRAAVLTSWRAVLTNPVTMACWALCLIVITLIAMIPALLGLVVAVPWLAHASWHAYRDLVDASELPERP
ncbi:conserved membrane hypothetical protein [Rubrivivax sp. A210]|uniref:DUF2189 domain-containing protein n=1 Tax=Rubrivivax sp. A210 TaxID=2772301 RepID=UPI00191A535B|nr:DUF2189 domain-containing protein [Rubrivivax sp. A210]CAD5371906.1 conserved membrane hypothetical protein [Rubrivivax sp. A210]